MPSTVDLIMQTATEGGVTPVCLARIAALLEGLPSPVEQPCSGCKELKKYAMSIKFLDDVASEIRVSTKK
jgi:hypothetical protein